MGNISPIQRMQIKQDNEDGNCIVPTTIAQVTQSIKDTHQLSKSFK